jgi:hypothetical protein
LDDRKYFVTGFLHKGVTYKNLGISKNDKFCMRISQRTRHKFLTDIAQKKILEIHIHLVGKIIETYTDKKENQTFLIYKESSNKVIYKEGLPNI